MKVALYYPWVYLRSGVERMMLELVQRSRHDWIIFTSHYFPEQTFPGYREVALVELAEVPVSRGYSAVCQAGVTILKQKIDLDDFDALVVSSEGLGDFITFRNHSVPVICYCHTPLKIVHDSHTRDRYLQENRRMKVPFLVFSGIFKFFDKLAWRYYDYVFCNSNEVKRRILKSGLAPAGKIEVLSPGLDLQVMKPGWEYQRYFVVVGRIKWWKNLELAINSFLEFKRAHPEFNDFQLQIVGMVEAGSEFYFEKLQELARGRDDIVFKRDPGEQELLAAYRYSYCLLFPSINEDWGMTPIEAMGFGKPVVAVNLGGPTESIINGVTGLLVEPEAKEFAAAMARLAADPGMVRRMGEAGVSHVQKYDWSHFVDRFDSYLDSLQK
ncbi:D-inositol 3-phosphate glycosyltransferase [bacterium BMS3Abin01]|nr:D-inositol 3-phosphate glycosyltransferase [bacterium BMS3Abin01]